MNSCAKSVEPPLAAAGAPVVPSLPDGDPYRALDDLMAVVEALCPAWPPREPLRPGATMLL